MNNVPVIMPQMGQSIAEGQIVKWHKRVGDQVAADEILVEIESDKINFQVESPAAGKLSSCLKHEGDIAVVGETIGLIASESSKPLPQRAGARPHAGHEQEQILVGAASAFEGIDHDSLPDVTRDWYSPYVLRLAVQNNISNEELKSIPGSGRQGRVTREDILRHIGQRSPGTLPAPPSRPQEALPPDAAEQGEVVPMTTVRRTIADHMVQSIHTSAHVTMVHAVDMTHIVMLRESIKRVFEQKYGVKMSYMTVMIYATAHVLKDFPTLNAAVHGANIVRKRDVNIGIAVALPDESLVVPVIRHADKMAFPQLAQEVERLVRLAREKALRREDVEGGTFTISNFGAFGSLIGTPIIHQPQVAILGMGAVYKAPVVVENDICIRDQMYLSFSFDHRVIDGAMGGRFLNAIQRFTESLTEDDLDIATL